MTAPPANSDEDFYMDESFDDESLSEVEEEPEEEPDEQPDEDVQEDSDSRSESDVEAEFLRGNVSAKQLKQPEELIVKHFSLHMATPTPPPAAHASPTPPTHPQPHARRQQLCGSRSGGGSGFPRDQMLAYNSSSEDEAQVVIRKTVVEVNQTKQYSVHTDDETLSDRTLVPNINPEDSDLTEIEDDDDDEDDDDEEGIEMNENDIAYGVDYNGKSVVSEQKIEEVQIAQLKKGQLSDSNKSRPSVPQKELVDVVDCDSDIGSCSGESDEDPFSPQSTDNDMDYTPMPTAQKKHRPSKFFPNLKRQPIVPDHPLENPPPPPVMMEVPPLPKLEDVNIDNGLEIPGPDGMGMIPPDTFNVKFLEQQMTQMSEMIMKTFRLSGGAADSNAFEQLAMATKLMKNQSKKLSEMEETPDSISTVESAITPTTVRSEILGNSDKCRCPSITDDVEPEVEDEGDEEEEGSFLLDECGQGDGLMRYAHTQQTHPSRINCRVSSVTPTSFNSDNCGYHIDIRRPRSTTSSEKVNYKNVGRKSFSFTNPQVREIERQNNILLKKMMHVKPTIKPIVNAVKSNSNLPVKNQAPTAPRLTSAAVNRKKYQRQIDLDNDVLKRKLEAVGSRRPIFK